MKKFFFLILLITIALNACGRKGPLEYPGEQKRPKFDKVIDEKN
ncbi:MAG: lipoprotein [Rickettsiales bacterium]|nr:lipoprotein [Rickettsiales bacterium]